MKLTVRPHKTRKTDDGAYVAEVEYEFSTPILL